MLALRYYRFNVNQIRITFDNFIYFVGYFFSSFSIRYVMTLYTSRYVYYYVEKYKSYAYRNASVGSEKNWIKHLIWFAYSPILLVIDWAARKTREWVSLMSMSSTRRLAQRNSKLMIVVWITVNTISWTDEVVPTHNYQRKSVTKWSSWQKWKKKRIFRYPNIAITCLRFCWNKSKNYEIPNSKSRIQISLFVIISAKYSPLLRRYKTKTFRENDDFKINIFN